MRGRVKSKRYRKVEKGLDFCLIAACFAVCLLSAALRAGEECRSRKNQENRKNGDSNERAEEHHGI